MGWVVGTGTVVGLLVIALGVVALRTGRVLPVSRWHVTRPRLYGAGVLVLGASLLLPGLSALHLLPGVPEEARFLGGTGLLLAGMVLLLVSQLSPLHRDRRSAL
ncbi:hypothetical protein [Streptomyces termitum]|uniref:hypothetical protein n=1 Tax=Streptomyces termitum TaxID=67368 RepID=UPI0033AF2196